MNSKINRIMVCIDFSPYSVASLEFAVELTRARQTPILVFNVINQRDINGVEMAVGYFPGYFSPAVNAAEYVEKESAERMEQLTNMIADRFAAEKSRMQVKIGVGVPYDCILQTAESDQVDMIVMGNKGMGNISRVLFGSTAEKVFRHSPVPVVSVRDKNSFKRQ
jgi:nucleotide-binding universal stress UspA family protein